VWWHSCYLTASHHALQLYPTLQACSRSVNVQPSRNVHKCSQNLAASQIPRRYWADLEQVAYRATTAIRRQSRPGELCAQDLRTVVFVWHSAVNTALQSTTAHGAVCLSCNCRCSKYDNHTANTFTVSNKWSFVIICHHGLCIQRNTDTANYELKNV